MIRTLVVSLLVGHAFGAAPVNITLAAIMPVQNDANHSGSAGDLGYAWASVYRFAIEMVNNNSAVLPNTKIITKIYDSMGKERIATLRALQAVEQGANGIVGGYHSSNSMRIADMLQVYGMSEISFGSTSPALSNKAKYPYFFRQVPPDSKTAIALTAIVQACGWSSVGTLSTLDDYASGGITAVIDTATAAGVTIMTRATSPFKGTPADAEKALQKLKDVKVRIVVMFMTLSDIKQTIKAVAKLKLKFQFLGPSSVTGSYVSAAKMPEFSQGFLGYLGFTPFPGGGAVFTDVKTKWGAVNNCPNRNAKGDIIPGCDVGNIAQFNAAGAFVGDLSTYTNGGITKFPVYWTYVYDAVLSFSYAFDSLIKAQTEVCHALKQNTCIKGSTAATSFLDGSCTKNTPCVSALFKKLQTLETVGATGTTGALSFDAVQDRKLWTYLLVNWRDTTTPFFGSPLGTYSPVGGFDPTMQFYTTNKAIQWSTGTSEMPVDVVRCAKGQTESLVTGACEKCKPGTKGEMVSGNAVCNPCDTGSAVGVFGWDKGGCPYCQPGYNQKLKGKSACDKCPQGTFTGSVATKLDCPKCEKGFWSGFNSSSCTMCAQGTYGNAKGTTQCTSCQGVITGSTSFRAATASTECVCPDNKYMRGKQSAQVAQNTATCIPCTTGLSCPRGTVLPKQAAGYYVELVGAQYSVYECFTGGPACISGPIGKCGAGRTGFMCLSCPSGTTKHVLNEDSEPNEMGCNECVEAKKLVLIGVPIIGIIVLGVMLHETKNSPLDDSPLWIQVQGAMGQLIMFIQILGALQAANLDFGGPMNYLIEALAAPVELNQFFNMAPCLDHGFYDPLTIFATQVALPAIFVVLLGCTFLITNAVKKNFFNANGLLNVIGEILVEFYISVTMTVCAPFNCFSHPNDKASMVAFPSIICGEGKHTSMVVLAILALLAYPVNAMVTTMVATWLHPKCMVKCDIGILIRCHFLFNRWSPPCYWFSLVMVTRNFCVALAPMVIPETAPDVTVALMIIVLMIAFLMCARLFPRRTPAMNRLDTHISFCQVLVLCVGGMTTFGGNLKSDGMSYVLCVLCISVFVVAGIIIAITGTQWLATKANLNIKTPGAWEFDCFLDHHAGSGVAAARTLCMVLTQGLRANVFYDVDYMLMGRGVGVIMDAVKVSKYCVSVMSNETWCQYWSSAAIVSAVRAHVPVQTILFSGSNTDIFAQELDAQTINILAKQAPRNRLRPLGIHDADVPRALAVALNVRPMIFDMKTAESLGSMMSSLVNVMPKAPLKPGLDISTVSARFFCKSDIGQQGGAQWWGDKKYILLSSDSEDPEAIATSRLFYRLIQDYLTSAHTTTAGNGRSRGSYDDAKAISSAEADILNGLNCIEDYDLDATEFAQFVKSDQCQATIVLFTQWTLQSTPQLLRLGSLNKNAPATTPFKPLPLSISDSFSFPGTAVLTGINSGSALNLKGGLAATSMRYTGEVVSLSSVREAVQFSLEPSIGFINVPQVTGQKLIALLTRVVWRVARRRMAKGRESVSGGTGQSNIWRKYSQQLESGEIKVEEVKQEDSAPAPVAIGAAPEAAGANRAAAYSSTIKVGRGDVNGGGNI